MIRHYLDNRPDEYWAIGRSTHLALMGDTLRDRSEKNLVILEIESERRSSRGGYARRGLPVHHALELAAFLSGALVHINLEKPNNFGRSADTYSVYAIDRDIILTLSDTLESEGRLATLILPPEEAREMMFELLNLGTMLMNRILHDGPTPEKESLQAPSTVGV